MKPDLLVLLEDDRRKRRGALHFTWVFINAVMWLGFGAYLFYKLIGAGF